MPVTEQFSILEVAIAGHIDLACCILHLVRLDHLDGERVIHVPNCVLELALAAQDGTALATVNILRGMPQWGFAPKSTVLADVLLELLMHMLNRGRVFLFT